MAAPVSVRNLFLFYSDDIPEHRAVAEFLEKTLTAEEKQAITDLWRSAKPKVEPEKKALNWNDPTSQVSTYFTVGEVTQNDPRRIPTKGSTVEANILRLAKELDKVREKYGPLGVTSWYRPADVNREVGGVSNSQHIQGNAADVYPKAYDEAQFEREMERTWKGGVGRGQRKGRGFTHLDLGTPRVWDY